MTDGRLAFVLTGPWAKEAEPAEAYLGEMRVVATGPNVLKSAHKRAKTVGANPELKRLFRPHWEEAVTDKKEQGLRDAFDEAVTTLQLLELGIETGYYDAEVLRPVVLAKFEELFWTPATIDFLDYYDYIGVRFLAARYDYALGNFPRLDPPAPDLNAGLRFASFLDIFAQFYEDQDTKLFLKFLDDFVITQLNGQPIRERSFFRQYLRSEQLESRANKLLPRFRKLSRGFYKTVLWLNDIVKVVRASADKALSADVKVAPLTAADKSFAMFFSYWLAKLFGFSLEKTGYEARGTNWAALAKDHPLRLLSDSGYEVRPEAEDALNENELKTIRELLEKRLDTLRAIWKTAKEEIERSIRTKA